MEPAYFALLLVALHLRWETWTGQSAWWAPNEALTFVVVGFLLSAFAIVCPIKRNR
jgi:hypothetical protein